LPAGDNKILFDCFKPRIVPPHLYIHIPYCVTKCPYCDFYSAPIESLPNPDIYIDAVLDELSFCIGKFDTIFIGGGTPSAIPLKTFERLLKKIAERLKSGYEWSVEANPKDVTSELVRMLKDYGVNRFSIGFQSSSDNVLKRLGRRHSQKDNECAVETAMNAGFEKISGDIIFGLPNDELEKTLDFFLQNNISHLSAYELHVEGNSRWNIDGYDPSVSDEEKMKCMEKTIFILEERGIMRYEISNFAKPGFECRSHINVWSSGEYVGIGAGAHGFEQGIRYVHLPNTKEYVENKIVEYEDSNKLKENAIAMETMMLGMRMIRGIDIEKLSPLRKNALMNRKNILDSLTADGLIEIFGSIIKPTSRGLLFVNEIALRFA